MMRAAIYARRSTDEHQAASLDVQLGEARSYCESNGWSIEEDHVFIEDAVSRAEFVKRPALIRMLNAAKDRLFDVVVVRDETRLGGDITRTGLLIQDLLETGCQLYYYFTDERVTLDGAVDKFMVAARNFAAELEREKISQRTREHLMVKARRGLNAGGKCFGYDNVRVEDRVEYRINEQQAEIVRDVFRRYRDGQGLSTIARALNEEGVAPPRAGRRGTGSWSPGQIRSMLHNERYAGWIIWGRMEKTYRGGTKVRVRKADCEVLRFEMPELRIIDEELWAATRERMEKSCRRYGTTAPKSKQPRHLLSGIARCAECGGPIRVESSKLGNRTVKVYACSYNRTRGKVVCGNGLRRPIEEVNGAVLGWIRRNILTEEVVIEVIRALRRRLEERAKTAGPDISKLESQAAKLKKEIANGVDALVKMGHSPAVAAAVAEREADLQRIEGRIEAAKAAPGTIDLETRRLESEARDRLLKLRELLESKPIEARKAMEALVDGPIYFKPESVEEKRRYRVTGTIAWADLICPTLSVPKEVSTILQEKVRPRSFEYLLEADSTIDQHRWRRRRES